MEKIKFAQGGFMSQPDVIPGTADSFIPEECINVENLRTALKLDLLLLELEESLGDIVITLNGRNLTQ